MQRKANGDGSISKRGDRYYGRLRVGKSLDGKPIIKNFSGKSEADVRKQIREFNRTSPIAMDSSRVSFKEYSKMWLNVFKKPALKSKSYDRLEQTLMYQVYPYIGAIMFDKVNDVDIQFVMTELEKSGLSYSTIKKAYDAINAVYNHAVARGVISRNPANTVEPPSASKFDHDDIKFFTIEEAVRISEECRRIYNTGKPVYVYGDVYILMLNTGLRVGELIALRKSDYDSENKTISVSRNASYVNKRDSEGDRLVGRELQYGTTKTYSGTRTIPLNETAVAAVEKLIVNNSKQDLLVCNSVGNPLTPEALTRTFYRMLDNIGLERRGVHSLRHTFASILFANKYDVAVVSKLLGHASISITMNTYIHLIDKTDHSAVASLDKLF